jgi:antitoxin VapB
VAINIKNAEVDRLARELTAATGETLTEAVLNALRERMARQRRVRQAPGGARDILRDARLRLSRLPVLDNRPVDEIVGYDETGLPH